MRAHAWSNGSPSASGSGYGLAISPKDRDLHLDPGVTAVMVRLGGSKEVVISLSPSFWRNCPEFRSAEIGRWLLDEGHAPWPKGKPPIFTMEPDPDGAWTVTPTQARK